MKTESCFHASWFWKTFPWNLSRCTLRAHRVSTSSVFLAWICGCGTRLQRTIHNSLPLLFSQRSIYEAFPRAWGHPHCLRILVSSLSDNFSLLKSVCVPSVTWCHKQLVLPWQLYRIKVLLLVKLWVMWPSAVAGEGRHEIITYFATKTNPDSHKRKTNPELKVPCELITPLAIIRKPSFFDFVISTCSTRCDTLRSVPSFPPVLLWPRNVYLF